MSATSSYIPRNSVSLRCILLQNVRSRGKEPDRQTLNAAIFPSLSPFSRPSQERNQIRPVTPFSTPKLVHYDAVKTSNAQIFPSLHPLSNKTQVSPIPANQAQKLASSQSIKTVNTQIFPSLHPLASVGCEKSQLGPRPAFPTPRVIDLEPMKKVKMNDNSENIILRPCNSSTQIEKENPISKFLSEFDDVVFSKKSTSKRPKREKKPVDMLKLYDELASGIQEPLVIPDNFLRELVSLQKQKFELLQQDQKNLAMAEGFDCKIFPKKEEEEHNSENSQPTSHKLALDYFSPEDGSFSKNEEDLTDSDTLSLPKKEMDSVEAKKENIKQEIQ